MSLAQQFAQVREGIAPHPCTARYGCPVCRESLAALSVIERHVQEMETALELVEEMTAGRAGVSGIADIARTALPAREKGTE